MRLTTPIIHPNNNTRRGIVVQVSNVDRPHVSLWLTRCFSLPSLSKVTLSLKISLWAIAAWYGDAADGLFKHNLRRPSEEDELQPAMADNILTCNFAVKWLYVYSNSTEMCYRDQIDKERAFILAWCQTVDKS